MPINGQQHPEVDAAAIEAQLSPQEQMNLETGRIAWRELQRFFAQGRVIAISPALDLVNVATELQADNKAQFEAWLAAEAVAQVSDTQAAAWYEADAELWTVVVSPWVLVQAPH